MNKPIVFYDGECGFCNKVVQFVLEHEKKEEIHFTALQSSFAQEFLSKQGLHNVDYSTFYFWDQKILSNQSTAALKLLKHLNYPIKLLQVCWIIPRFIRDGVYQLIARNRKKLAGNFCALPTPEQRKRFLD